MNNKSALLFVVSVICSSSSLAGEGFVGKALSPLPLMVSSARIVSSAPDFNGAHGTYRSSRALEWSAFGNKLSMGLEGGFSGVRIKDQTYSQDRFVGIYLKAPLL